jgi:hypothetical protein
LLVGTSGLVSQPCGQHLLGLLPALAAVCLRVAKNVAELGVPRLVGVPDVGLQPEGVVQARLGKSNDVVVLGRGAGDISGTAIGGHSSNPSPPVSPVGLP